MPVRPSDNEEEYFSREEMERRKKFEEEKQKKIAQEEKHRLKELHYMRCPKCGMELNEIEYKGIRIDKCFNCEGVWFDAGELDTLSKFEKTSMDKLLSIFRKLE